MTRKSKFIYFFLLSLSGGLGFFLSAHHFSAKPQRERHLIKTFHYPALLAKQWQGDVFAGEKIFKEFCAACHSPIPQIDINAPKIGDKKRWEALNKLGKSKLIAITIEGKNAMPARGGCFECSDEQLNQAIIYILRNSGIQ